MTALDRGAAPVAAALRCPRCLGRLGVTDRACTCVECGTAYPVVRGVPVLVDAATSLFDPAEIAVATSSFVAHSRLRRLVPELSVNLMARRNYTRLRELLRADGLPATVLVVGGGDGGAGIAALGGDGITLVTSDIQLGGATDLVADAHRLPFADGTFDAVVAQAVLEHVVDPWRCVEELHRVLRPDGLVYAETPFMQQVHMAPYDFTRFTPLGHRRLFRRFAELDTGAAVGAGSALAWSLAYFVAGFGRSPRSRRLLYAAGCVLFAWVRNFDRVLRTDAALDAAAGCYFLGRRSERVLSDRELITRYRGGVDVGGERS